ncbi:ABC transporter ATP-binding protein [Actinokineospora guangxiensis]|uniref:ABC transporter ATP-binding protein n=1 Tax=Actinokineospora guangxiensis TaxID=1490288 RepID=A0ABW0ES42_9PSEU
MRYGTKDVLHGVDFEVRTGELVALLGPNGAGKSTTIEILEGFRARSGGEVEVLGTDPAQGDETWRAGLGIVLQSWRDHAKWRVRELLAHLGRYYPDPFDTDELLELVGLTGQQGQRAGTLSGGQRRRLDVAIGIVGRPRLLFLDEPTAGFDPQARREFHELVHRLVDVENTTVLLTTHDLAEAEKLADRILILAQGRILADGSAVELARTVAGKAEIRWTRGGKHFVHTADEVEDYVRELLAEPGEPVRDLEVRRTSLEDTYMAMVHRTEGS